MALQPAYRIYFKSSGRAVSIAGQKTFIKVYDTSNHEPVAYTHGNFTKKKKAPFRNTLLVSDEDIRKPGFRNTFKSTIIRAS
jgi:hypothetical protein